MSLYHWNKVDVYRQELISAVKPLRGAHKLLIQGIYAGGSWYAHSGGGANYLSI